MTPAMQAAMGAARVRLAGLLKIELPDHIIRLCDGSGVVTWGGETFTGRDPVFGTIGDVEALNEQIGDSIPGLDLTLLPPSTSAATTLASAAMQGAPASLWLAVVNDDGGVLPDPELLFTGEIDQPVLAIDRGSRELSFSLASAWEHLFEPNEGANLSDTFHQSVHPGQRGFANMTGVETNKLWGPGNKPPALAVAPAVPQTGPNRFF